MFGAIAVISLAATATFHSWISPEIAQKITEDYVNGEYYSYLDYNGDGKEDIMDAIGILKRYNHNLTYGNTITFDQQSMDEIAEENGLDIIDWSIDFIDNRPCRKYSYTADKTTTIKVYYDTEEGDGETLTIELNPIEERFILK